MLLSLFVILLVIAIYLYINGLLIQFFNGDYLYFHIAENLNNHNLFLYGALLLLSVSWIIIFIKKLKKWQMILVLVNSILLVPIYGYIIFNEYTKEKTPITEVKMVELQNLLDYSKVQKFDYDKEDFTLTVELDYGKSRREIFAEYIDNQNHTNNSQDHQIKQRLNSDVITIINQVWMTTHHPKKIRFHIYWNDQRLFTSTANKREKILSFFDQDETDEFNEKEEAPYYKLAFQEEGHTVYVQYLNDHGKWNKIKLGEKEVSN